MMKNDFTFCAPAERLGVREVRRQHGRLADHRCAGYFNFFPLPLLVVNSQRQIVFYNEAFSSFLGIRRFADIENKRPGEAMGCVYADQQDAGCGTAEYCRECGALKAVMESISTGRPSEHECQLLLKTPTGISAKDLRVHASPWRIEDDIYHVVSIVDIGDEKRRRVLERVFYHDILNSAGNAKVLVEILQEEIAGNARQTAELVDSALFSLVEEVKKQKELAALETGQYSISPITLRAHEVVRILIREYSNHPLALDKMIIFDEKSSRAEVVADHALLRRVLTNMLTNALEATPSGGAVRMGLRREAETVVIWVNNKTVMPARVRLQVFKRSFSTKGQGRGLGTYSIKLLTENYLGGEVGFSSGEPDGTTFWVRLCRESFCRLKH